MSITQTHITIITPCYNEGIVVTRFLEHLENILATLPYNFCVLVINDGSTDNTPGLLKDFQFKIDNAGLDTLNLEHNVGHQSAIYHGLLHAQTYESRHFIIMDCDGQDSPSAIPLLLKYKDADIVNVVRSKRRESMVFRLFYQVYKIIFRVVTGKQMNFGNFCLINRNILERAIELSFAHFAAFLSRQKGSIKSIVVAREVRIGGQSKMGFKKLFYHALKSFAEYEKDTPMLKFLFLKRSFRNRIDLQDRTR